jgi:hypothetical protein
VRQYWAAVGGGRCWPHGLGANSAALGVRSHCYNCFLILRKHANLILNLFALMVDSNVQDIALDPEKTVLKVRAPGRWSALGGIRWHAMIVAGAVRRCKRSFVWIWTMNRR